MTIASRFLKYAGLLCILGLFIPVLTRNVIENGTQHRFTLGIPQSPWFVYSSTESRAETKLNGNYSMSFNRSFNTNMEFVSWSSLLAVIGVVLLTASKFVGSPPDRSETETHREALN